MIRVLVEMKLEIDNNISQRKQSFTKLEIPTDKGTYLNRLPIEESFLNDLTLLEFLPHPDRITGVFPPTGKFCVGKAIG